MRRASRDYSKYLRGAEELGGGAPPHESAPPTPPGPGGAAPQAHAAPAASSRTLLAALAVLGLGQVLCSLALFLYFRAQMDPNRISEEDTHCLRTFLRLQGNIDLQETTLVNQERLMSESCRRMKQAFQGAMQKEVQRIIVGNDQSRSEKSIMGASWLDLPKISKPDKPPFAHLIIDGNKIPAGTGKVNLTSWHHDKGWANVVNMTFSDGKLIANHDGFYYLYANVCFRHHEAVGNLTGQTLQLMVYVRKTDVKRKNPVVLMKGGSTKNWSGDSEFHFYSVNVGGFFKLKSGEVVSIQVSHPSLLDRSPEGTYFGAFKVRDID